MQFSSFVGIDVSKEKLDVFIWEKAQHRVVSNSAKGCKEMLKWLASNGCLLKTTLICFEHTGIYALPLHLFLAEQKLCFVQVPGLAVKRSMGLQRGKNDRVDAALLSKYAYLYREELVLSQPLDSELLRLKMLLSLRNRMVGQRASYQTSVKETTSVLGIKKSDSLIKVQTEQIKQLKHNIEKLDKEMMDIINANPALQKNMVLATSVKGIGPQNALTMIITTVNFTLFKDARSFACYAGIAPFEHQSGKSYKGKTRISHLGNRHVKALLSNAAASAIQNNPEMKMYYNRRIKAGKHPMSTLNIIRNKLVARVFAAVSRQTPYVDTFKFAA
jgi:transposase